MDNTGGQGQRTENLGEMPQVGMEHTTGTGTAVDRGADRLVEVIDQAVAQISDERERNLVREGVLTVIRDTLHELVEQESRRPGALAGGNGAMAIGDATQAGMAAARQVRDLGFVEFTAGLIDGTFNSLIAATVKQMDAYAKLVADLAKTLAEFQAENVSDAQITAHLTQRYPDGAGGTTVRANVDFTDTPANPETGAQGKTANEKFQEVVDALVDETKNLHPPLTRESDSLNIQATNASIKQFDNDQVKMIREAMARLLATSMVEHLRAMAREGMARIVVQRGKILSKLTFNVNATDQQSKQASQFHQDSFGVAVKGSAGWGPFSVSAGVDYNQLNVSTVNESSFDSVTMSAEIIGQVELEFKTESFPPQITAGESTT